MNEQAKSKIIPKQSLAIQNYDVGVPYSGGTKQLDRFQAVNLSLAEDNPLLGKPLRFTIFKDKLKTFARGKTNIIADFEERDRPGTEYGPDRTVVQIYDDAGNPVSTEKGTGGGAEYQRRSLGDDLALEAVKRVSIEGQTAVAQVGEWLRNPQAKTAGLTQEQLDRIIGKYWKAVEKSLDNYLAAPPGKSQAEKQTTSAPPAPRPTAPNGQGTARKTPAVATDSPRDDADSSASQDGPIKNVGDLLTRASRLDPPVTRGDIIVAQEVTDPAQIKDLEAAWKQAREISKSKSVTAGETSEETWGNMNRQGT